MSKHKIKLPGGEIVEVAACDALTDQGRYIGDDCVGRCCVNFPDLEKVDGKLIYRQKLYEFIMKGKKFNICEDCLKLWMDEPERISFR